MRLWQFRFSANVERVAIALAHKGLDAQPVEIDPADRSAVREVSGQDLVPVLEHDGDVVCDSTRILLYLEGRFPDPPLLPGSRARREEILVFCDWFDRVWKVAPNRLADDGPDPLSEAELRASLDRFEALLEGRDHLFGDELTLADVVAFPFLRYGLRRHPEDTERFHQVLVEQIAVQPNHPRVRMWIERVDARPRTGTTQLASEPSV